MKKIVLISIVFLSLLTACSTTRNNQSEYLSKDNDLITSLKLSHSPSSGKELNINGTWFKVWHKVYSNHEGFHSLDSAIIYFARFHNFKTVSTPYLTNKGIDYLPKEILDEIKRKDKEWPRMYTQTMYIITDSNDNALYSVLAMSSDYIYATAFAMVFNQSITSEIYANYQKSKIENEKQYAERQIRDAEIKATREKNLKQSLSHDYIISQILANNMLKFLEKDVDIKNIKPQNLKIYNYDSRCESYYNFDCKPFLEVSLPEEKLLLLLCVTLTRDNLVKDIKLSNVIASKHRTSNDYYTMWTDVLNPPRDANSFWSRD